MNKKRTLLIIAGIIGLILFQRELLIPIAKDAATSDLFLKDTNDLASPYSQSNEMTQFAFVHCNAQAKESLGGKVNVNFGQAPTRAWSTGGYDYVVTADAVVTKENGETKTKKYLCNITYNNGDDTSGAAQAANWTLHGIKLSADGNE